MLKDWIQFVALRLEAQILLHFKHLRSNTHLSPSPPSHLRPYFQDMLDAHFWWQDLQLNARAFSLWHLLCLCLKHWRRNERGREIVTWGRCLLMPYVLKTHRVDARPLSSVFYDVVSRLYARHAKSTSDLSQVWAWRSHAVGWYSLQRLLAWLFKYRPTFECWIGNRSFAERPKLQNTSVTGRVCARPDADENSGASTDPTCKCTWVDYIGPVIQTSDVTPKLSYLASSLIFSISRMRTIVFLTTR